MRPSSAVPSSTNPKPRDVGRHAVGDDLSRGDRTVGRQHLSELIAVHGVGKTADVEFHSRSSVELVALSCQRCRGEVGGESFEELVRRQPLLPH